MKNVRALLSALVLAVVLCLPSLAVASEADQIWSAAQQAFDIGEFDQARSLCEDVLAEEPSNTEAVRMLNLLDRLIALHETAKAAEEAGKDQEALDGYRNILEINPQDLHAAGRIEYLEQKIRDASKNANEKAVKKATRGMPSVESTGFYQYAKSDLWGVGHGFLFNLDLQPEAWMQRRVHLGTEFGLMFYGDTEMTIADFNLVLGYQHYHHEKWAPVIRVCGGASYNRYFGWRPNYGLDGGMKLVVAPEFHLEALVGTSANAPLRLSVGMGTNAKYAGYAALLVLLLGLAAVG